MFFFFFFGQRRTSALKLCESFAPQFQNQAAGCARGRNMRLLCQRWAKGFEDRPSTSLQTKHHDPEVDQNSCTSPGPTEVAHSNISGNIMLGAAAEGSTPALALCHSQKVYKKLLLFLQHLVISSRCSISCHYLLCPVPVRHGCRMPLPLVSFSSFSLFPTPNQPCQFERCPKARHEADSFEPAEWSERLTPGQSGWLGAAAVDSIPAFARCRQIGSFPW